MGNFGSGGSRIFLGGEEAPTPKVGMVTICFAFFLPKTAWKWKNLDPGGEGVSGALLDPQMFGWITAIQMSH